MRFDLITIFPNIFNSYFNESIIKRAQKSGKIKIKIWNLRDFTKDKHKKVDDRPFGGGPGMVLKIEPLFYCVKKLLGKFLKKQISKTLIMIFSASGKQFDAPMAQNFAKKYDRIIMICGHYEGIDERIKKVVSDFGFRILDLSVGPYVLTGGELPAMVIADAISRQITGVLGKIESLEEKRHGIGVPVYTRPEVFKFKGRTYTSSIPPGAPS
ncbi:MAG: tRNA (guanosine(37)-N1)-methyltransferase TrmD, partial [Patescibacteria group bacterium]